MTTREKIQTKILELQELQKQQQDEIDENERVLGSQRRNIQRADQSRGVNIIWEELTSAYLTRNGEFHPDNLEEDDEQAKETCECNDYDCSICYIMIKSHTERAKVPGGWLIRTDYANESGVQNILGMGLCFLPDPEHRWLIETTIENSTAR